jgi:hypothetical protein
MRADKNSSRRRSKLQQDELARSDTQNHTLCTSTFLLPKPRSHLSATGPRNKYYQQPRLLHEHSSGNNSGACWQGGGGLAEYGGAIRPPPQPLASTNTPHSFTSRNLWSRPSWLSGNLGENQNFTQGPSGRQATRGGLTSCTQQETPNKNT